MGLTFFIFEVAVWPWGLELQFPSGAVDALDESVRSSQTICYSLWDLGATGMQIRSIWQPLIRHQ